MRKTTPRTGLAIHGSTVALSVSRAATSHLRKHYRTRYRGRYRFARAVFVFDLVLLSIGIGLLMLNVALMFGSTSTPIGMSLSLKARDLVAGDVMPVEATVRSTDAATHPHVRLTWHMPPWVEILRADPPLDANGTTEIGEVRPTQERRSRLYVRIRGTPGMAVPFSFRLDDGSGAGAPVLSGSESRRIATSAVQFEPMLASPSAVPGSVIPFRVVNRGSVAAPAVIVRLMRSDAASQSTLGENGDARIGMLLPGASKTVLLRVDPAARGTASFDFEVQDASRPINLAHITVPMVTTPAITILGAAVSPDGRSIDVAYRSTAPGSISAIASSRASSTDDVVTVDVSPQESSIRIPLPQGTVTSEWILIPHEQRAGNSIIGFEKMVGIGTSFPFATRIRYYADGGDQIGVGPLPPTVGEATSYWVVMSLGPTSSPLRSVRLEATLGDHVQPTGKHASVIPGDVNVNGSRVSWTIPDIPASPAEPVTFAFEVVLTPVASDRGRSPTLVEKTTATALDASTGVSLFASTDALSTDLTQDPLASGKGRVE